MNNNYQWDLQAILQNKSLEDLYNQWIKQRDLVIKLFPLFYSDKNHFIDFLKANESFGILSNRLINFLSNNHNEDLINPEWLAWLQKLNQDYNIISVAMSNYDNLVITHEAKIREYLKDPKISEYTRAFELIFKTKPHLLSDKEEKLLSRLSLSSGGISAVFDTLTDSEIKYEPAITRDNKKVKLVTISDVNLALKSNDRTLRKSAWINFNKAFDNFKNTLTQTLYYNYLELNTDARIRNFKNYIDSTCFSDEIKPEFISHVYDEIARFKSLHQKYRAVVNKLLQKQLKLSKLHPWDKTVDLSKKAIRFSIEQAKIETLAALAPLKESYLNNVKKAFDENWISWLPKPNKQTGAYSIGSTKGLTKMYISMNFDKTIRSINTLVHELGHSMHSVAFNKHQKVYTSCAIFYAEIASITNEVLLGYYWLEKFKNDRKMKALVYDSLLRDFFSTTTRQIIFSNFEFEANKLVNEQKPFTNESLQELYSQMIDKYEGLSLQQKNDYKKIPYSYSMSTILRISHFYVGNFYVYKYAIGQIAAIIIATKIYKNDSSALERYFKFLNSGSSLDPLETIKLLGIDLTSHEPFKEVRDIVNTWIKDFSDLK